MENKELKKKLSELAEERVKQLDKELKKKLSELAEERVKQLEGLSRRDRQKMIEINDQYQKKVDKIMLAHRKQEAAKKKQTEAINPKEMKE